MNITYCAIVVTLRRITLRASSERQKERGIDLRLSELHPSSVEGGGGGGGRSNWLQDEEWRRRRRFFFHLLYGRKGGGREIGAGGKWNGGGENGKTDGEEEEEEEEGPFGKEEEEGGSELHFLPPISLRKRRRKEGVRDFLLLIHYVFPIFLPLLFAPQPLQSPLQVEWGRVCDFPPVRKKKRSRGAILTRRPTTFTFP